MAGWNNSHLNKWVIPAPCSEPAASAFHACRTASRARFQTMLFDMCTDTWPYCNCMFYNLDRQRQTLAEQRIAQITGNVMSKGVQEGSCVFQRRAHTMCDKAETEVKMCRVHTGPVCLSDVRLLVYILPALRALETAEQSY